MFRKSNKTPKTKQVDKAVSIPSIITKDMHILGNIVNEDGTIDIDGSLDGNIRCHSITIRPNGVITGEITADEVQVYGSVNGLIKAKTVNLLSGCHIEGIVMHEQLSVQDGAYIDGKCKRMDKPALQDAFQEALDDTSSSELLQNDEDVGAKPVKILENIRLIS